MTSIRLVEIFLQYDDFYKEFEKFFVGEGGAEVSF